MPAPSAKTKFRKQLGKLRDDAQALLTNAGEPWWVADNAQRVATITTQVDTMLKSTALDMEPAADKAARKAKPTEAAAEDVKPQPGDAVHVRAGLPEYAAVPPAALAGWKLLEIRGHTAVCSIEGMPDPAYLPYSHLEVVAS